jgi:hypothetical protein
MAVRPHSTWYFSETLIFSWSEFRPGIMLCAAKWNKGRSDSTNSWCVKFKLRGWFVKGFFSEVKLTFSYLKSS